MARVRKRTWESGAETKTAWIADYFDQNRKRHLKTFKRQRDAQDWLNQTKVDIKQGILPQPALASL